jgi:hypothetical protein
VGKGYFVIRYVLKLAKTIVTISRKFNGIYILLVPTLYFVPAIPVSPLTHR